MAEKLAILAIVIVGFVVARIEIALVHSTEKELQKIGAFILVTMMGLIVIGSINIVLFAALKQHETSDLPG
jgi:hypothetical protein